MPVIHLIAPSGYCVKQEAARRGVERLVSSGHEVQNQAVLPRRFQRFAGDDNARLSDLSEIAQLSNSTDIVLAVRGGYGMTRLIESIDFDAIAQRLEQAPLAICGHSDFTAFQMALLAKHPQAITFSGPMLTGNFGAEDLNTFTWNHFWQALQEPEFTLQWVSESTPFETSGTLWGGNLSMIASMVGSSWLPNIEGGILVLEDVNEHPFRVERMLIQLLRAGILNKQRAIILGSFNGTTLNTYDDGYNFDVMCDFLRSKLTVPLVTGLNFGHEARTVTLPLGATARLSHQGDMAMLTISGHPVLRR